jgi:hypothetical protein
MGQIGCPETSVHNYHLKLRNIPEERRSNEQAVVGTDQQTLCKGAKNLVKMISVFLKGGVKFWLLP